MAETDEQFVNWSGNILQHHHWKPNDGEAITESSAVEMMDYLIISMWNVYNPEGKHD